MLQNRRSVVGSAFTDRIFGSGAPHRTRKQFAEKSVLTSLGPAGHSLSGDPTRERACHRGSPLRNTDGFPLRRHHAVPTTGPFPLLDDALPHSAQKNITPSQPPVQVFPYSMNALPPTGFRSEEHHAVPTTGPGFPLLDKRTSPDGFPLRGTSRRPHHRSRFFPTR